MKKGFQFILSICFLVVLAGCIQFQGGGGAQNDGGVYKSIDKGLTWSQKVSIPEVGGKVVGFPNANVMTMVFDPQDRNAIYLGTEKDGMFYTYDGGDRWRHVTPIFASGRIPAIAVDYFNKCVIYAATANKIYKSSDCSRTWAQIYFDTEETTTVESLATEGYNQNVIYAGTSRGEVLKSVDYGTTWNVVNRLKTDIVNIMVDKKDTRVVFVTTKTGGTYKTSDAGASWLDISDDIKKFKDGKTYRALVMDQNNSELLIYACKYGLLKSTNGGVNWEEMKLITPPSGANILSVAFDPTNSDIIYYGTDSTFYTSTDAGQNWKAQKLPTSRRAQFLLVDPIKPETIYMGTRFVKEQ